jgi:hypothetical protein
MNNLDRIVTGAIVDHDYFHVPLLLRDIVENLSQCGIETSTLVVCGDDDAVGVMFQGRSQLSVLFEIPTDSLSYLALFQHGEEFADEFFIP